MHVKNWLILVLWASVATEAGGRLHGQNTVCQDLRAMISLMDTFHVQPIAPDKVLPQVMPALFFDALDPSYLFLTASDRKTLTQAAIRDAHGKASEMGCLLYQSALALYQQKLVIGDSVLVQLLAHAPAYTGAEWWIEDLTGHPDVAQADRLRQLVKLNVLETYIALGDSVRGDFAQAEPRLRALACERLRCRIHRKQHLPEGLDAYVGTLLLDAVAASYDPHSAYFTEDIKNGFESGLSVSAATFGFWVIENEAGEIVISYLTPGGPARSSGKLKENAVITFLQFGNAPAINMACTQSDEINEQLASMPANTLTLRVRDEEGRETEITLQGRVMDVESNAVNSFLLTGKVKAGYLYLPGFYSDWGSNDAAGCANDVARELHKMERAGVEGVILDLRGNGGGSLEEAIHLAGIFLPEGPLGMMKGDDGRINVLVERNRRAAYDGPVVVLVDCWSASASEIFAAIMQDYHRAVIVGDTTYGKSTAQNIFPLPGNPAAYVKITTNHFLRITGETHQGNGVYPDVPFPVNDPEEAREKDQARALRPTRMGGFTYAPLPAIPVESLRKAASKRANQSADIALSATLYEDLTRFYQQMDTMLLMPDAFLAYHRTWENILKQSEKLDSVQISAYEATIPGYAKSGLSHHAVMKEMLQEQREDIQRDLKIEHAYHILSDIIKN